MWFIDTETFKYDWLFVAINTKGEEKIIYNDRKGLIDFYNQYRKDVWVMFNGANYDQYIIKGILLGFDPKTINDWIIIKGRKGWEYSPLFNKIPMVLYDTMPKPPVGLKTLEGFLGYNIHETSVPFDIDRKLTDNEMQETIDYCHDDVLNTMIVFTYKFSEFNSHLGLVKEFNLPFTDLGKTQAQLAAKILGARRVKTTDEWNIRLPDNLKLGKYFYIGDWFMDEKSHQYDKKLQCTVGNIPTVIAWGGGHGAIKQFSYKCKENEMIVDADVGQLYPNIMIEYNLLSRAVKDPKKFKNVLDTSMRLKHEGKKKQREPYKRICNITYGACGDKYNAMYDPLHRNLVCVFGQVLLVDLIDKLDHLIRLVQFNTDGIFFICKKDDFEEIKRITNEWEDRTHLKMEYDFYDGIFQKDVNNYIATGEENHYKGSYVKNLSELDYDLPIVNKAMKEFIINGVPIEQTIGFCDDLREFQKIVKLSSKYKWVEHEEGCYEQQHVKHFKNGKTRTKYTVECTNNVRYDNKAYRVFASKDFRDGRLLKCDGVRNPAKFGNTPDHCFVENGDVKGKRCPVKLDKAWYVNLARKRLQDFGFKF